MILTASIAGAGDVRDRSLFSILDNLVHPIETVSVLPEGARTQTWGTGFVVGRFFVTATAHLGHGPDSISYAAGSPLWHGSHFPQFRVSVLPLSDSACQALCTRLPVAMNAAPEVGQAVAWMDKALGRTALVHAHVISSNSVSPKRRVDCAESAWIKVDQPFRPENFGVPVVGAGDGAILGVAIANLTMSDSRFGVVVPFSCLLEHADGSDHAHRSLAQFNSP